MDLETVHSSSGMELISENITEEIAKLNEEIEQKPKVIKGGSPKKRRRRFLSKTKRQLDQDFIPRAKKYEEAERIFQGRNSFSKTDHDATFMCMKERSHEKSRIKTWI